MLVLRFRRSHAAAWAAARAVLDTLVSAASTTTNSVVVDIPRAVLDTASTTTYGVVDIPAFSVLNAASRATTAAAPRSARRLTNPAFRASSSKTNLAALGGRTWKDLGCDHGVAFLLARRGTVLGHTGVCHGTNKHRTNKHDHVDHPRAWRDRSTPSRVLVCPQHHAPRDRRSRLLRGIPGS